MEIPVVYLTTYHTDGTVTSKGGRIILEHWEVPNKPRAGLPDIGESVPFLEGWTDVTLKEVLAELSKPLKRQLTEEEYENLLSYGQE